MQRLREKVGEFAIFKRKGRTRYVLIPLLLEAVHQSSHNIVVLMRNPSIIPTMKTRVDKINRSFITPELLQLPFVLLHLLYGKSDGAWCVRICDLSPVLTQKNKGLLLIKYAVRPCARGISRERHQLLYMWQTKSGVLTKIEPGFGLIPPVAIGQSELQTILRLLLGAEFVDVRS